MSSSPSGSRNGRFERERQDGPVDHLRVVAKRHVLVPGTVGEQKIFSPRYGRSSHGEDGHTAGTAA